SLARWLREHHAGVSLVMLTTESETVDRIIGLELGADDYVPKPFDLRELLARVRAVLRRATTTPVPAPQPAALETTATRRITFGSCQLDLDERRLCDADGNEIAITAAEFDLLALFARHPNRPLNRDQIMEQAHNRGWDVFDRSIDLRIMRATPTSPRSSRLCATSATCSCRHSPVALDEAGRPRARRCRAGRPGDAARAARPHPRSRHRSRHRPPLSLRQPRVPAILRLARRAGARSPCCRASRRRNFRELRAGGRAAARRRIDPLGRLGRLPGAGPALHAGALAAVRAGRRRSARGDRLRARPHRAEAARA
ncbi:MAG: response regulator, partial [Betaproteobacteria bacterium]